jgi:hypothetical protein
LKSAAATAFLAVLLTSGASAENLLSNGNFPIASVAGWTLEDPTSSELAWNSADYLSAMSSGSAQLTNKHAGGGQGTGMVQCVGAIVPGAHYDWGGSMYLASGQSRTGELQLGLRIYDGPGCTGTAIDQPRLEAFSFDTWVARSSVGYEMPVGAASLELVAFPSKVEAGGTLVGLFDHLFIVPNCTGKPKGDASGNGVLDVQDVFYMINRLFAAGPAQVCSADVNADGAFSVLDAFYLINFLFAGGPAPL